jgi:hypothetical protein
MWTTFTLYFCFITANVVAFTAEGFLCIESNKDVTLRILR